jgi:hypothetical protein
VQEAMGRLAFEPFVALVVVAHDLPKAFWRYSAGVRPVLSLNCSEKKKLDSN